MKIFCKTVLIILLITNNLMAQTSTLTPPSLDISSCTGLSGNGYSACVQQQQNSYQTQLDAYNKANAAQQAAAAAQLSAKQAALDAQNQNQKATSSYNLSSTLTGIASGVAFAKFFASCTPVCSNYPALAIGIAMAAFSIMASKQANTHANTAFSACDVANKISSDQASCGAPPANYDPTGYPNSGDNPISKVIDSNGNCVASKDYCDTVTSNLPPGTSLKDAAKGFSAFASGKIPMKVNPDGTVTNTKTGKTIDPATLNSPEALAAAGVTGADAAALLGQMKKNADLAAEFDAKKALNGLNGNGSGSPFDTIAGGPGGPGSGNANSAGNGDASADGKDGGANGLNGKNRGLASAEGLVKDFNGEQIGVAGDDIWKMMSRRYHLKETQDSFMRGAKP